MAAEPKLSLLGDEQRVLEETIGGAGLGDDPAFVALRRLLARSHPAIRSITGSDIPVKPNSSAGLKVAKGLAIPLGIVPCLGCYMYGKALLVPSGHLAITENAGRPEFLGQGRHFLLDPRRALIRMVSLKEEVISHGTTSLVTVPAGHVGYCSCEGEAILLPPGMHIWDHPTLQFLSLHDVSKPVVELGPYTLITVREGMCAVTTRNGVMEILGAEDMTKLTAGDGMAEGEASGSTLKGSRRNRTYLLDNQMWRFATWLDLSEQFDLLESHELLTNDRVEVDLKSTVAWRVVDPLVAAKRAEGGDGMQSIRTLVHREARATVADLILGTKISAGVQGPRSRIKAQSEAAAEAEAGELFGEEEEDAPSALRRGGVSNNSVDACSKRLERIGVHVDTINIVEFSIRGAKIKENLAQAAVLSTKVKESSEIARTDAKNEEVKARSKAEARRLQAKADADAIEFDFQAKEAVLHTKVREANELADAEARNIEVKAKAAAEAARMKARAQAENIELIAEAEAKATRIRSAAAKEAGALLSSDSLATELERIRTTGLALGEAKSTVITPQGIDVSRMFANPQMISRE